MNYCYIMLAGLRYLKLLWYGGSLSHLQAQEKLSEMKLRQRLCCIYNLYFVIFKLKCWIHSPQPLCTPINHISSTSVEIGYLFPFSITLLIHPTWYLVVELGGARYVAKIVLTTEIRYQFNYSKIEVAVRWGLIGPSPKPTRKRTGPF